MKKKKWEKIGGGKIIQETKWDDKIQFSLGIQVVVTPCAFHRTVNFFTGEDRSEVFGNFGKILKIIFVDSYQMKKSNVFLNI